MGTNELSQLPSNKDSSPPTPKSQSYGLPVELVKTIAATVHMSRNAVIMNPPSPKRMDFAAIQRNVVVVADKDRRGDDREKAEASARLIAVSGVPPRYRDARLNDLGDVPQEIVEPYRSAVRAAQQLVTRPGILALIGPRGVGKTWIACGLVLGFCRAGRSARYAHVMDYFIGLKETYGQSAKTTEGKYENDHLRPALLVLDEMHEPADTDWEGRMLRRVIVKRHDLQLATILLSNEEEDAFKRRVQDSIVSRMKDDAGGIVVCNWRSLRGRNS